MTTDTSLTAMVFIVTGSARGVGRGITTALLERGAAVLATDIIDLSALTDDLSDHGERLRTVTGDIRDPRTIDRVTEAANAEFGGIDGVVNNAIAIPQPTALTDITDETFCLTFDTGPRATFAVMKAVHPHLVRRGGGSIVNLGSGAGTGGQPGQAAYAGAKEAVRGISKVAALEWGPDNIRVNVICPFANSEGALTWEQVEPAAFHAAISAIPLGRIGDTVTDVGALAAFLLGPNSAYITAQTILIDGGGGSFR